MLGNNTLNLTLKDNPELSDLLADIKPGDQFSLCVTLTAKSKSDEAISCAVTEAGDMEMEESEEEEDSTVKVKDSDSEEEDSEDASSAMYVAKSGDKKDMMTE